EIIQELNSLHARYAMGMSQTMLSQPPDTLPKLLKEIPESRRYRARELLTIDIEAHMRGVLSAGCLCFVLVGCPVGIWFSKSDYLSAFVTCFLPIVFLYYPLMLCGINVARGGRIPILLCMWPCNLLMAAISVALLKRLMRH